MLGRITYNWANRYISEFDFRYDGTSKFANAHRWSFFPSISAAWLVTDEPFLSTYRHNVGHIKLRTSYGVLGNQASMLTTASHVTFCITTLTPLTTRG